MTVNQGPGGIVASRLSSSGSLTANDRQIGEIEVPLATAWTITSGDYYLGWSNSVASGSLFFPPIVPTNGGGNAQKSDNGGTYTLATDNGSGRAVELPFMLVGTVVPEPSTVILSVISGLFVVAGVRRKRLGR